MFTTIQDIKIGQQFHCKVHSKYKAPRLMTLVGVSESGAFLVRCDNQVNIFINPNAPIVLVENPRSIFDFVDLPKSQIAQLELAEKR